MDKDVEQVRSCSTATTAREIHSRLTRPGRRLSLYLSNLIIAMYGRCGELVEAQRVYHEMQSKNSFSTRAMLRACIANGSIEEAATVFERAETSEVCILCCTDMINAFSSVGRVLDAERAFSRISSNPDVVAWTALLSCYCRCRRLDAANRCFDTMPSRNEVSWTAILSGYTQAGSSGLQAANALFHKMPARIVVTWNAMLVGYAQTGDLQECQSLFTSMPEMNSASCNAMLSAFSDNGRMDLASELFESMLQRDVISWNTVLAALAAEGHLERAEVAYRFMPAWSLCSGNSMLAAYAQAGKLEQCRALYNSMDCQRKNTETHNVMVNAYSSAGDVDSAREIFDRIGDSRDIVTWTTLLHGYLSHPGGRHVDEARILFESMPRRDVLCWTAMLHGYSERGRSKNAKEILERMPSWSVVSLNAMLAMATTAAAAKEFFDSMAERTVVSANALITAFANSGHFDEAEKLMAKMPAWDVVSWNTLLAGQAAAGRIHQAATTFDIAPQRNAVSWNAMLAAGARSGAPEHCWSTTRYMCLQGEALDASSFVCLLVACSHSGSLKTGQGIFMAMVGDHYVEPIREHYSCFVDLLARAGHLDDAEELVAHMPFVPDAASWQSLLAGCRSYRDGKIAEKAATQASLFDFSNAVPYVLLANVRVDLQP